MTLDEFFRDQISRGQPPLVALHNAAQAYAADLRTKDFLTHDLIKKLPKGWTTLYARYDELEEWLRFLGSRTYRIVHFNEFVHIVIGPEESTKQCQCRTGTACKPTCTCHDGYQSGGCDRCGTYGLPDCSQYDDETKAWGEPNDSEAVELLREQCQRMKKYRDNGGCLTFGESDWFYRVLKFLDGKQ